jgi:proline iminopeptidase
MTHRPVRSRFGGELAEDEMTALRTLYEPVEPFESGWLPVSGGHEIYYEQCGRPDGKPALYVHGGPGGGIEPKNRGYFDPSAYRAVLFEQRGTGRSRPSAELEGNTTWDLVADMERLREHCGIDRWLLFGGSWGATLCLAYAERHPDRVTEMILRGVFLGRDAELRWLYSPDGAAAFHPEKFEAFLAPIPEEERGDVVAAYHRRLFGADQDQREACARAWSIWEGSVSRLQPDPEEIRKYSEPEFSLSLARIASHYFLHGCFLEANQLLRDAGKISGIRGIVVQGRYDMVCPPAAAWELHRAWPASRLAWIADAGHSASEPGIADALIRATDCHRK